MKRHCIAGLLVTVGMVMSASSAATAQSRSALRMDRLGEGLVTDELVIRRTAEGGKLKPDDGAIATALPLITPVPPYLLGQDVSDVVDVANQNGAFSTFLGLLDELGMLEDLRGYGRFTVFAPTNAAFEKLGAEVLDTLRGDREQLAKILAYHIISSGERLYASDINGTVRYRTLERSDVELQGRRGTLFVNGVETTIVDNSPSNGIIYGIEQVLLPPSP